MTASYIVGEHEINKTRARIPMADTWQGLSVLVWPRYNGDHASTHKHNHDCTQTNA